MSDKLSIDFRHERNLQGTGVAQQLYDELFRMVRVCRIFERRFNQLMNPMDIVRFLVTHFEVQVPHSRTR